MVLFFFPIQLLQQVVLSKTNGFGIRSFNKKLGFGSPLYVEVKTIWNGLVEAKALSLTRMIVESDSKLSMYICTDQRHWVGPFQKLFHDIESLLIELNACLQFVHRSCNWVAHWLARNALTQSSGGQVFSRLPNALLRLLYFDHSSIIDVCRQVVTMVFLCHKLGLSIKLNGGTVLL